MYGSSMHAVVDFNNGICCAHTSCTGRGRQGRQVPQDNSRRFGSIVGGIPVPHALYHHTESNSCLCPRRYQNKVHQLRFQRCGCVRNTSGMTSTLPARPLPIPARTPERACIVYVR